MAASSPSENRSGTSGSGRDSPRWWRRAVHATAHASSSVVHLVRRRPRGLRQPQPGRPQGGQPGRAALGGPLRRHRVGPHRGERHLRVHLEDRQPGAAADPGVDLGDLAAQVEPLVAQPLAGRAPVGLVRLLPGRGQHRGPDRRREHRRLPARRAARPGPPRRPARSPCRAARSGCRRRPPRPARRRPRRPVVGDRGRRRTARPGRRRAARRPTPPRQPSTPEHRALTSRARPRAGPKRRPSMPSPLHSTTMLDVPLGQVAAQGLDARVAAAVREHRPPGRSIRP